MSGFSGYADDQNNPQQQEKSKDNFLMIKRADSKVYDDPFASQQQSSRNDKMPSPLKISTKKKQGLNKYPPLNVQTGNWFQNPTMKQSVTMKQSSKFQLKESQRQAEQYNNLLVSKILEKQQNAQQSDPMKLSMHMEGMTKSQAFRARGRRFNQNAAEILNQVLQTQEKMKQITQKSNQTMMNISQEEIKLEQQKQKLQQQREAEQSKNFLLRNKLNLAHRAHKIQKRRGYTQHNQSAQESIGLKNNIQGEEYSYQNLKSYQVSTLAYLSRYVNKNPDASLPTLIEPASREIQLQHEIIKEQVEEDYQQRLQEFQLKNKMFSEDNISHLPLKVQKSILDERPKSSVHPDLLSYIPGQGFNNNNLVKNRHQYCQQNKSADHNEFRVNKPVKKGQWMFNSKQAKLLGGEKLE